MTIIASDEVLDIGEIHIKCRPSYERANNALREAALSICQVLRFEEAWKENVVKHMQQLDGCSSPGTQPTIPTLALE